MNQVGNQSNYISPNFGAMKKSQFKGLDLFCVNTFKAPIEKFNTLTDLQNWAGSKLNKDTFSKNLQARSSRATFERNSALASWLNYFNNAKDATKAAALVAMTSLFGGLKNKTDDVPPPLDEEVLKNTLNEVENKQSFNFKKEYVTNLQNKLVGDRDNLKQGWVSIPSKENDSENFKSNVAKLQLLSNGTWCTKSTKAEEYLSCGDFHILYDNYEPVIGIKTNGNMVYEIQGKANNANIPLEYLDNVVEYIHKKGLDTGIVQGYIDYAYEKCFTINEYKRAFAKEIQNNDGLNVLRKFGMNPEVVEGGFVLGKLKMLENGVVLSDLGFNENEIFKDLVRIEDDAIFTNSKATKLPKLEYIGGDADFRNSFVNDISSLKEINGDVYIAGCNLTADDFKNVKIKGEIITGR